LPGRARVREWGSYENYLGWGRDSCVVFHLVFEFRGLA
jgi:hypothetical protein